MAGNGYDGKELISQVLSVKAHKLWQGCYEIMLVKEIRRYGTNTC